MVIAAADVKPAITGTDIKSITTPSLCVEVIECLCQAFPFDMISAMQDNGLAENMSFYLEF